MSKILHLKSVLLSMLVIAAGMLAAVEPVDERQVMNQNTAQLSAGLLIGQLRDAFGKRGVDSEPLYQIMIKNPAKYASSEAALKLLSQDYAAQLQQSYKVDAQKLLDAVRSRYKGGADFFPTNFVLESLQLPEQYIQENLRNVFPPAFKLAREKAASEQRLRIVGSTYPTENEVDTLSETELVKKLQEQLLQDWSNVIFDENRGFVRDSIVTPLVKEALAQKDEQLKVLSNVDISEALMPQEYEAEMNKQLLELLTRRKSNPSERKVYEIFPSVKTKMAERAKVLTVNKFISTLSHFKPDLNEEKLAAEMLKSPSLHITPESSLETFYDAYRRQVFTRAATAYFARVPADKRSELRVFLEPNAMNDEVADQQLRPQFNKNIAPTVRQVRQLVAKAQFKKFLPELQDGNWMPPSDALAAYKQNPKTNLPQEWRTLPGLEISASNEATLLSESRKLITDSLTAAFDLALKALGRQQELSDNVHTDLVRLFESAQSDVNLKHTVLLHEYLAIPADTPITEQSVAQAYKTKVLTAWNEQRVPFLWPPGVARPGNFTAMYTTLFASISAEIDQRAALLMAELKNLLPEEYGAAKNVPGLKVINCNMDVAMDDGGYTIAVSSPQSPLLRQTFTLPLSRDSVDATPYKEVQAEAVDFLSKIITNTPAGEKNMIQVFIRVRNGKIPYEFVADLSALTRRELRELPYKAETRFRVADELKQEF